MENPLNILNEIQAPDLTNENLSRSLNEVFEKINDNFKKIISAPIYRGQQGESVKIASVCLYENGRYTTEGQKVIRAIFNTPTKKYVPDEWDGDDGELINGFRDTYYHSINTVTVTNYIKDNPNILMFQLNNVEHTNISPAQLYAFQDARISVLPGQDVNFKDASCYISFESTDEGNSYTYVRVDQFPTICWSDSIQDYVWSINNIKTNIIAKGLKGLDASFTLPLFLVTETEDHQFWKVTHIFLEGQWVEINNSEIDLGIYSAGMGCVGYMYQKSEGTISITGLEITTINSVDPDPTRPLITLKKMGANISADPLNVMMDSIRPYILTEVVDSTIPALYIPAQSNDDEDGYVHALWRQSSADQEDTKPLHIGYAKIESRPGGNKVMNTNMDDKTTELILHNYNHIRFGYGGQISSRQINLDEGNIKIENDCVSLLIAPNGINLGTTGHKLQINPSETKLTINNTRNITVDNTGVVKLNGGKLFVDGWFQCVSGKFAVASNVFKTNVGAIELNNTNESPHDIKIGNNNGSRVYISGIFINLKSNSINLNNYPYTKLSEIKYKEFEPYKYQQCHSKYGENISWINAQSGSLVKLKAKFYVRDGVGFFKFVVPEAINVTTTSLVYDSSESYNRTDSYNVNMTEAVIAEWDVTDLFTGLGYKPSVSEYYACGIWIDSDYALRDNRSVVGYLFMNSTGTVILKLKYVNPYVLQNVTFKSLLAKTDVTEQKYFVKKASLQYGCYKASLGSGIGEGFVSFPVTIQ